MGTRAQTLRAPGIAKLQSTKTKGTAYTSQEISEGFPATMRCDRDSDITIAPFFFYAFQLEIPGCTPKSALRVPIGRGWTRLRGTPRVRQLIIPFESYKFSNNRYK